MKTTNQFDYPTASATTYKAYKPQTAPQDDSKERYQKIGDTKRSTPVEMLCQGHPGYYSGKF